MRYREGSPSTARSLVANLLHRVSPNLCRFYGASGEEIISIGADVPNDGAPPCHASVSRMTLADP
jgi:hypothetical protein